MIKNNLKRMISLFLVLMMVFSMAPVSAFAEDTEPTAETVAEVTSESPQAPSEEPTEELTGEATEPETIKETQASMKENPYIAGFQAEMDRILMDYLGSADLASEEVFALVSQLGETDLSNAAVEILILDEDIQFSIDDGLITEAEAQSLLDNNPTVLTFASYLVDYLPDYSLYADGNYAPATGVNVTVTSATTTNEANGVITVTAQGKSGLFSGYTTTSTITVYNNSGATATVSFDWTATNINELKIDGTKYTVASNSFSKLLENTKSVVITIKTAKNSTENKLVMKNFAATAAATSSNITFSYNDLGSVTVDGTAVASGNSATVPISGSTLVATPVSGAVFLGWIDSDNRVLSNSASYTLTPANDMEITAAFAGASSAAWFYANGNYSLFNNLTEACNYATNVNTKTVTLAANGTLPAGDYTIPAGVTLLIPYNAANTLCTTKPTTSDATYAKPTVYRKLTMAEGANIIVNGALSLSATQASGGAQSSPTGPCSFVQMNSGSSITVNSGANLYAWGYIQGSGAVTIKGGATVYECFQIMDWRGGTNTSGMNNNANRVFPFSQYYVQNVEVPMTLEAGAIEKCFMSVQITLAGIQDALVPFIGPDAMFNINSGYIIKDYNESNGRLKIDTYGNIALQDFAMTIKLALIGNTTLDASKYTLPITGSMDIHLYGGTMTVNQDLALLPGVKMIVGSGAKITLGAGKKLYVYDYDEWTRKDVGADGKDPSFCGTAGATYVNLKYPTSATTVTGRADDAYVEVNGTADLSAGYVYTTEGGANICSSGSGTIKLNAGTETVTYQSYCGGDDNKTLVYVEIPVTPAKLKNADGTYIQSGTNTYTYTDGYWRCETHTDEDKNHNCDVCGFVTECADTDDHNCDICGKEAISECKDENKDSVCDICGANLCDHSNKTPVEAVAATCEAAGNSKYYTCTCGQFLAEDGVTPIAEGSWVISKLGHDESGEWQDDGTNHYQICGKCNTKINVEAHSGGTATCVAKKVCTTCNKEYGETDTTDGHSFSTDWTTDGTNHWKVCQNGCGAKGSEGAHSGGTANCQDQAVCSTCQTPYGKTDSNNHKSVKTDAAVAATCEAAGLTEGSHCEACDTVITAQKEVPALDHEEGAAATCTTAQTCTRCSHVFTEALGHSYTNYVSNNDAKCEVDGTKTAKCDRCDETSTITDEGSKLGHSYTQYVSNNNATCQTNATETASCDNGCGGKDTRPIADSMVDHSYGKYFSDNNAACLKDGTKTAKCIWCKNTDTVTDTGSALDHSFTNYVSDGNATCMTDGTKTAKCDNNCGETSTITDAGSALGHSFTNYVPDGNETCADEGTETAKCDRCDVTNTRDATGVQLKPHTFTNYVYNNDATCFADGTKTAHCDVCNTATDEIIAEGTQLSHRYTNYVSNNDATCTQDGTKSALCDHNCGTKDTIADTGSKLGHSFTKFVSNRDATCTANGTETAKCDRCEEEKTQEDADSKLDHSFTQYESNNDATCTADGTETAKCDNCDATHTRTQAGSMKDHEMGQWVEVTPAGCTTKGVERQDCENCDHFETKETDALGHNMGAWVTTTNPTCIIDGEERSDCDRCDHYETKVLKANGHDYHSEVTLEPTCVAKGTETYTCSKCQDTYTKELAETGVHTEATREENRVEATCGADGSYVLVTYCSVCDAVIKEEQKTIPATGAHTYEPSVTKEPTCIALGEKTYTCSGCDASYTEEMAMVDHKVSDSYTTEDGKHFLACLTEGCSYKENEAVCSDAEGDGDHSCDVCEAPDVSGHTESEPVVENYKGATCTSAGSYDSVVRCAECNAELSRTPHTVSQSNHDFGDWEIITNATCTTDGSQKRACTVCGHEETGSIPATGHNETTTTTVDATCTTEGSVSVTCNTCGETVSTQTIPVIPHVYVKGFCTVCDGFEPATQNTEGFYEIGNAGQLYWFAAQVNGGNGTMNAVLTANIVVNENVLDANGDRNTGDFRKWENIGIDKNMYVGTFDGYGYSISGLYEEDSLSRTYAGLFGYVGSDGVVRNLAILDSYFKSGTTIGSIAGYNGGTIQNCYSDATVVCTTATIGGIAGETGGTITSCYFVGKLAPDSTTRDMGPIVAYKWNSGIIENCYYLAESETDSLEGTTFKTEAQFASGEVAYLLNGGSAEGVWKQTIGTDAYPTFDGAAVYKNQIGGCTDSTFTYAYSNTRETDVINHSWVEATCTKPMTCSACGATDGEKLDHIFTNYVPNNDATCTADGTKTAKCDRCGTATDTVTNEGSMLNHSFLNYVSDNNATCTKNGTETAKCEGCEATDTREDADSKLKHTFTEEQSRTPATCKEEGSITWKCVSCDATTVETLAIDPSNHVEVIRVDAKAPACAEAGHEAYEYCTACSYTTFKEVAATGHGYEATVTAPTHTEAGYTTYTCHCGDSYVANEVDALGHRYNAEITTAPTCTTEGIKTFTCACGDAYTEVIAVTDHTLIRVDAKAPSCTESGYEAYEYCTECDYTTRKEVAHLGHKPGAATEVNRVESSCSVAGSYESVVSCSVCGTEISRETVKLPLAEHSWEDATYDAPKTCTECGKTLGDPLVRPVEIVKPEYVTAEPSEGISKEEVEEAMSSVVDSIVEAAQKTEQPETGINAEKNKTAVENAKTEIKDKDQNVVTGHSYETSLVITLNAVVLDKDEENVITKKVTFDVSPILYALDANGTKIGQTKITSFAEPITFRLPVAENTKAKFARVLHEGVDDLGLYKILTDAAGNRFVEVKSKKFSQFSLVLEEECTEHDFVDGKCTICGAEKPVELFPFYGANIDMGNTLDMNFYILQSYFTGDGYYATITHTKADGSKNVKTIAKSDWLKNGSYFQITYDGIMAKEMSDTISVVIYSDDGIQVSMEKIDGIRTYCMRMFNSQNDKTKKLFVDMLNYGAAAQTMFNYNKNDLANSLLTEEQQKYATQASTCTDGRIKGANYYGTNFDLENRISMNLYFANLNTEMYAIVTFTNHFGEKKNIRIEGTAFIENGSYHQINIAEAVVADGRCDITCVVYDANGNEVASVVDSMESYVARNGASYPDLVAMMKFSDSAYNYLH